jgi:hypothetical protein
MQSWQRHSCAQGRQSLAQLAARDRYKHASNLSSNSTICAPFPNNALIECSSALTIGVLQTMIVAFLFALTLLSCNLLRWPLLERLEQHRLVLLLLDLVRVLPGEER